MAQLLGVLDWGSKASASSSASAIYKKPVLRVTRLYLNLLVKRRFFQDFWKKYNLMHFESLSKCIKLYFFQKKEKTIKKNMCAYPTQNSQTSYTPLFFYLA